MNFIINKINSGNLDMKRFDVEPNLASGAYSTHPYKFTMKGYVFYVCPEDYGPLKKKAGISYYSKKLAANFSDADCAPVRVYQRAMVDFVSSVMESSYKFRRRVCG